MKTESAILVLLIIAAIVYFSSKNESTVPNFKHVTTNRNVHKSRGPDEYAITIVNQSTAGIRGVLKFKNCNPKSFDVPFDGQYEFQTTCAPVELLIQAKIFPITPIPGPMTIIYWGALREHPATVTTRYS